MTAGNYFTIKIYYSAPIRTFFASVSDGNVTVVKSASSVAPYSPGWCPEIRFGSSAGGNDDWYGYNVTFDLTKMYIEQDGTRIWE